MDEDEEYEGGEGEELEPEMINNGETRTRTMKGWMWTRTTSSPPGIDHQEEDERARGGGKEAVRRPTNDDTVYDEIRTRKF